MRLNNVFSGRPAYYDRNPLRLANASFSAALAPHAAATRFTYTVPTGRTFMLGFAEVQVVRVTAAGTPSRLNSDVYYAANAIVDATVWGNAVNDARIISASGGTTFVAGDVLTGKDQDASTGGTVDFTQSLFGTEFDT